MATISDIVQQSMADATQKVAATGGATAPAPEIEWTPQAAPVEELDINVLDQIADALDGQSKVASPQAEVTPQEREAEKLALAALAVDQGLAPPEEVVPVMVNPAILAGPRPAATQGAIKEAIKQAAAPLARGYT